jgi:hypothetical protein
MQSDRSRAPLRSALIGAVVIGTLVQAMSQGMFSLRYAGLYALIYVVGLGAVVPISIVLITRRSPALVTTIAVLLLRIPMIRFDPSMVVSIVVSGVLVWFACTLPSLASSDERRAPGVRMRCRWWMPVVGIVLLSAPYVVRASYSDPYVPVGAVTALFTVPAALVLLAIWIPAFLVDAVGALLTGRAARKEALAREVP